MKLWIVYFIQHLDTDTPLFLAAQTKEIAESVAWYAHTFKDVSIIKGPECEDIQDVHLYNAVIESEEGFMWNKGGKLI